MLELLDYYFFTQTGAIKVKKPFPQLTFPCSITPLKWWKVKTMHLWTAEHLTTIQTWPHMVKLQISKTPTKFMNFHYLSCIYNSSKQQRHHSINVLPEPDYVIFYRSSVVPQTFISRKLLQLTCQMALNLIHNLWIDKSGRLPLYQYIPYLKQIELQHHPMSKHVMTRLHLRAFQLS